MISGMPGYQKLVNVNGYQLTLDAPMSIFPQQELKLKEYIQGGPRNQVYEMGKKILKGNLSFPITIDSNGNIDPAVKEMIECAQYPMRGLTIFTNYTLSQKYITADLRNWDSLGIPNNGFGIYNKITFEDCGITKMEISVQENQSATISAEVIGRIGTTTTPSQSLPAYGMMRRAVSYAECDVYLTDPVYHWDTSKEFKLNIENNIEPIYTLYDGLTVADTNNWTDLPSIIGMSTSHVNGHIKHSVDRGTADSEKQSLPSGAWVGSDLIFDISGVCEIKIPRMIANLTQQPIELGLLNRTTEFVALFRKTILDTNEGHFITFR